MVKHSGVEALKLIAGWNELENTNNLLKLNNEKQIFLSLVKYLI